MARELLYSIVKTIDMIMILLMFLTGFILFAIFFRLTEKGENIL